MFIPQTGGSQCPDRRGPERTMCLDTLMATRRVKSQAPGRDHDRPTPEEATSAHSSTWIREPGALSGPTAHRGEAGLPRAAVM